MSEMMFPESWRFTLIRKGAKRPIGNNWQEKPMTWDEAIKLYGKTYLGIEVGAIGVLSGAPSGGLLMLDHDGHSCDPILAEWGELPPTWSVSAGRDGHHQLAFWVPESYWGAIANARFLTGVKDADGKPEQVDLRWSQYQSLVFGEHPETGNQYQWVKHSGEIAEAPLFLIEKMLIEEHKQEDPPQPKERAQRQIKGEKTKQEWALEYLDFIDPNDLDWYTWRNCLLAAHDAGLSEHEVRQWSKTSTKHTDSGFSDVWRYIKGRTSAPLTLGTLGFLAKQGGWKGKERQPGAMPAVSSKSYSQSDYQSSSEAEENKAPDYHETLDQVDLLEDAIPNETELLWHLTNFAYEGGLNTRGFSASKLLQYARARRDQRQAIEVVDAIDILEGQEKPEFLIAGMLTRGTVGVTAAYGGSGKTTLIYDWARNIARGKPWSGYRTEQGRVLIIQTDEPRPNIAQKLRIQGWRDVPRGTVDFITKWRFTQFRELEKRVRGEGYALVVIDSWTAAHAGMGIDLTKSNAGDNAYLLRDLAESTNCCIEVIHHLNKMGDLRDSTTLKDNLSEVRTLKTREKDHDPSGLDRSLFIEKSRSDLMGEYILRQNPMDYSWSHLGAAGAQDDPNSEPLTTRIINYLRKKQNDYVSAWDISKYLGTDPHKAGIDLERLTRWGVLENEWVAEVAGDRQRGYWMYRMPYVDDEDRATYLVQLVRGGVSSVAELDGLQQEFSERVRRMAWEMLTNEEREHLRSLRKQQTAQEAA